MKSNFQKLALLGLVVLAFSCDNEENVNPLPDFTFNQIGLDNLKVYELVLLGNDSLFAATSDGVYVKKIRSDDPFVLIGLKSRNVVDLVVFSRDHIIVTTGNRGFSTDDPGIHETTDGGVSWKRSAFGDDEVEETAHSLSQHPTQASVIYATGNAVVAKSIDFGKSWQPIWGDWGGFASGTMMAEISTITPTDLWFGGQGGIENGYLGYLRNEHPARHWDALVDNPTVAVEVAFTNPGAPSIFVGFEGALLKTSNNGDNWKKVIDGHVNGLRFFYGIDKSSRNENHLYAGGWLKGVDRQPLVLYVSRDSGDTWDTKIFEDEPAGGIFTLKFVDDNGEDKIFAGLDGGGVYEIIVH